mmetsp:Transcript_126967/g.179149  ORF Transcript_126967/g.179149 Transcript_126967/m.179149 type:complete len:342 (-) Transcript_126967:226-1251(-)
MRALGFGLAAASAVCNGSFAALSKIWPIDPLIFNLHFCCGVFLSSMIAPTFYTITGNEMGVTVFGVLGGVLLVLSTLFSFLAIPRIGLAIGQGVWGGVAIIVSFLWGAVGPSEISNPVKSLTLSIIAVAYLILGIFGILLSERFSSTHLIPKYADALDENSNLITNPENLEDNTVQDSDTEVRATSTTVGLICAVLVGCFGGSILVPLSFVDDKYGGIGFLPSFGIGALASGVLLVGGSLVNDRTRIPSVKTFIQTSPPGMASGVVWNAGNVCSILAMGPAGNLSYGVAYPIMQCALFISGLWGIFYFKEIQGKVAIFGFLLSGTVLIGGAVVLGLYGPQA